MTAQTVETRRSRKREEEPIDQVETAKYAGKLSTEAADINPDAILAEIDEVLETNAADFLADFKQVGGQ